MLEMPVQQHGGLMLLMPRARWRRPVLESQRRLAHLVQEAQRRRRVLLQVQAQANARRRHAIRCGLSGVRHDGGEWPCCLRCRPQVCEVPVDGHHGDRRCSRVAGSRQQLAQRRSISVSSGND